MSNKGKTVKVHYTGTLDSGEKFDSSYDHGQPLEFQCGAGQMIKGFDEAVENMNVGDKVTVHLEPEDAYGEPRSELVIDFPVSEVPNVDQIHPGDKVYLQGPGGMPVPATIVSIDDSVVKVDANHELAGKPLNFEIELLSAE